MNKTDGLRMPNPFEWLPPEKRVSKFGPTLKPDKPEKRIPAFYVGIMYLDDWNVGIFFVNNTDEVLDSVKSDNGGFLTDDDDIVPIGGPNFSFENIQPNEAVQVESYHRMYDSDFVLQITMEVISKKWGTKEFSTTAKGEFGPEVLLWDNGETGHGEW